MDEASLRGLESLMTEFFHPVTTNIRKREIEEMLDKFSQQQDAWKHCLYFMENTANEYVMMYCMTALENVINRRWLGLESGAKTEIRSTLSRFMLAHHLQVASFIRNKLVKLVVDIGRIDWPHFYPDFYSSILQLVQQPSTVTVGLLLIQTTSEELASPREDLSVARKEELHRLLIQQVPATLATLNGILESTLEKHRSMVTATPPPSPIMGESAAQRRPSPTQVISGSPNPSGFVSNMFKSPSSRVSIETLPPLDAAAQQICGQALQCLAHLFSWIPLSSTITPHLLSTVFQLAAFGCDPACGSNQQLGVLAMCCINELLAKNCVPSEFEDFLLQMFQQTFYLLQRLTKDNTTSSTGNKLHQLDEAYVEKFTEFLRLFVSIHLRRFEANQHFPVLDFLALLFKYTFKQPQLEGYFSCLDIWNIFLDYLATKLEQRTGGGEARTLVLRYEEALQSLTNEIMRKMQFRFNQSQLDEMDDETLTDDNETEWQHFLRQNLETVARVAELQPATTFAQLSTPFSEYLDVYLGLGSYVVSAPDGTRKLTVSAENECRRLHCTLRDLSSLLQAIGRLSDHFIAEKFLDSFTDAHALIERLVEAVNYSNRLRLYDLTSPAAEGLVGDFVEVHAQALASVKANASWLAQFYVESRKHKDKQTATACDGMIRSLLDSSIGLIDPKTPEKIGLSAAHLILSLFTTIRPAFLLSVPCVQALYTQNLDGLSPEVQRLVLRSLSHHLLLPWPGVAAEDQQWETRLTHHIALIQRITADFNALRTRIIEDRQVQDSGRDTVRRTLSLLIELLDCSDTGIVSKSKHLLHQSLGPTIATSLAIFPVYISQPTVTEHILGFFLAMFQNLRVQMGVAFTENTIQTFINMFTREQLAETIMQETNAGFNVVEKFLQILQLIVQEPGASFRALLPNIITICMDQIYPIVAQRPSPDLKSILFTLLHEVLLNNWRYFFKGSVLSKIQTDGKNEEMENSHHFINIMQAYGQSFLQSDISIFKQNLESLEALNTKWKLYHKHIFVEMMMTQFLTVLMQVLVVKSHDLLQEEIGITVYNMAAEDFDGFYGNFLPHFLASCDGLDDNQKAILARNFHVDNDLPSFTQSIHRFVNDLRYYRLCNQSLPASSVKL